MSNNFILDYSKKQVCQISNDAFYYLYYDEKPLDENNLKEANEISKALSNNFYIDNNWRPLGNSGLIECTFIPYIESRIIYDEYYDLTKYIQLQIKWLDTNHIRVWQFNSQINTRELRGDFEVYLNNFGLKYFHTGNQSEDFITGKGSLYFLKNFKKHI